MVSREVVGYLSKYSKILNCVSVPYSTILKDTETVRGVYWKSVK
jgi:hypothetical protein